MSAEAHAAANVEKRRRMWVAWGASALVHLAAALMLLRLLRHHAAPVAPSPAAAAPVEISFLEAESGPVGPAAPAPAGSPAPRINPRPAVRPNLPRTETTPPPSVGAPGAAPPGEAPGPRTPPIDLSFDALAANAKHRAAGAAPPDEALERLLVPSPKPWGHRRDVGELRADAERRTDSIDNVERGRANPQLYDYLRGARARLESEATRLAEELPLGVSQTTKGWGRGYLKRVDEVHAGSARDLPESPDDAFGKRSDVLGGYNEAEHQATSGAEERTTEVCLGVAPDHPVVVTLRRSSGHTALDKLAVDSFRAAGDARPVAADVRAGLACYRVRISAFRMPPLPSLSFGLDKKGRPEVIYPFKRITKVTVELKSVDYGPAPRSSALVRAPR